MAFHRTYIADLLGAMSSELAYGVQSELAALISPSISDTYEGNWVYFIEPGTKVGVHECLVYFMPDGKSIVKHSPNRGSGDPQADSEDDTIHGSTNGNSGASEVYVKVRDAKFLAKIAFHELLHNRLKMGNSMHKPDGLRTGGDITVSTPLTNGNKRDMAAGISRSVPQWTDGLTILGNGRIDQISEYYQIN